MHGAGSVALEGEAAEVGEVLDEGDVLGLCGGRRLSSGRESRDWGRDESCGGDACQDGAFHGGLLGLFGRFQGTLRWPLVGRPIVAAHSGTRLKADWIGLERLTG